MNIFYLDKDPVRAAMMMTDKHIVKMILESAQLLSTAHRVLDGYEITHITSAGRRIKRYSHPTLDNVLYQSAYVNHPSNVWVRQSVENYNWLYEHFITLCVSYKLRFNRTHQTYEKLSLVLKDAPRNILAIEMTPIAQAMPDKYRDPNPILAYRKYYVTEKLKQLHDIHRYNKYLL